MSREYRVMWMGRGSKLKLQIGDVRDSHVGARIIRDGPTAMGLKHEGAIVWIESRQVGPWGVAPDEIPEPLTKAPVCPEAGT
jgi:hypothetical protein